MASPLMYFRNIVKNVSRSRLLKNRQKRRRLLMEPLERRALLAGDLASIAGVAYIDGVADTPLESATVDLYIDGGDGTFDRGDGGGDDVLVDSATTNAAGEYRFDNLTAGTYFVEQQAFAGLLQRPGEEVQTVVVTEADANGTLGLAIDNFDQTTQLVEDPDDMLDNASAVDTEPGEAIGGERDMVVERLSSMGRARLAANDLSSGFIELTLSTGAIGRGTATWDGDDDDSGTLDHTGLDNADLTGGGVNSAFRLAVGADHSGVAAELRIYTDAGNWSSFSSSVADTGSATPDTDNPVIIRFSDFTIEAGTGADLADIGAIQLVIAGVVDAQVGIDDLGVVGPTVLAADFANLEPLSLGDLVWLDANNSGTFEAGESGIEGVIVNLYEDTDGNNDLTPGTDLLLDTTTTDADGLYLFGGLLPGDYVVQIDSANFGLTGALAIVLDSTGNDPAPDPDDNDSNEDDNGLMLIDNGVVTRAVTLLAGTEPTTDGDTDANTNLSVDFGFTPASDLLVLKSDDTDPVWAGNQLTYTLHVTNNGPSAVTGVTVVDTLPGEVAFESATPSQGTADHVTGTVTVELGEIAAGVTANIEIIVTVDPATTVSSLLNTAVVSGENYDPDPANNTVEETTAVEKRIDLAITKSDSLDPVIAGEQLVYTLQVTNAGPSDATLVTVTDELPDGVTFVSGTSDQGLVSEADGIVTVDIGELDAGADPIEIAITVTVDSATRGTITNEAEAAGAETETDETNNTASAETTIDAVIDLAITKSDNLDPVAAGEQLVYTLEVTNSGPSGATNVSVTDTLPAGVSFVSAASDDASISHSAGVVTADIGNLASGADPVEIQITVAVDPSVRGTLDNLAVVTATEQELEDGNNQAEESTQVDALIDLAIDKVGDVDPVVVGGQLVYTLQVTNDGPSDATGVTVTDTLPAGTSLVSAVSDVGTPVESGGVVTVDIGDLAAGAEPVEITITVAVGSTAGATLLNEAVVDGVESETDETNNDDSVTTGVTPQIDLEIEKIAGSATVTAGRQLVYTLMVTNHGPSDATGVTVTDDLPTGVEFVSGTSDQGTVSESTGVVTVDVGALAAGADAIEITITVDVDPSARGTLLNEAEIAGNEDETDESNNQDSVTTNVTAEVDLAIEKTDSPDPVIAGEQLTYTLSVENNGPSDATNVVVADDLPAGVEFVSGTSDQGTVSESGGVVTVDVGEMAAGADAIEIEITVDVDPSTRNTITNSANVDSTEPDADESDNDIDEPTTVEGHVDLVVTKSDDDDPVIAGEQLTYTLTVTNDGPSDATNVVLTDTLPDEVTFDSGSSSQGTVTESGGVVTVDFGDLAVGEVATATIVVDVSAAANGTITNEAVVTADETEDDDTNNTALESTVVDELLSSLEGFVYYDGDGDGQMGPDEPGLPGVTVRLLGIDVEGEDVSEEAVTDEDGFYEFKDLRAGVYRLVETQPERFIDGLETVGTLPAVTDVNDEFSDIDLPGGVEAKDYLFGESARPFSKRRFLSSS